MSFVSRKNEKWIAKVISVYIWALSRNCIKIFIFTFQRLKVSNWSASSTSSPKFPLINPFHDKYKRKRSWCGAVLKLSHHICNVQHVSFSFVYACPCHAHEEYLPTFEYSHTKPSCIAAHVQTHHRRIFVFSTSYYCHQLCAISM